MSEGLGEKLSDDRPDGRSDDLAGSESETVRRHASAFRRDWGDEGEGSGRVRRGGYVDGTATDVTGDGLRVLGAVSAARVTLKAAESGWRVVGRFASHRRESDGAPVDAVVVMAMHLIDERTVDRWAMGHWRTDPIRPPMKRKWKFTGATAKDAERGIRSVGAKELAEIISPIVDALEC